LRIGVLFHCQYRGLAAALHALVPSAEVIAVGRGGLPEVAEERRQLIATLNACDHLISNHVEGTGPLSVASLRRTARRLHVLPALSFSGFHPDIVYVFRDDGTPLVGPTMDYHSRIAVAAYLAGLSAAETASLYNRLVFRRLGYLQSFGEECAMLTEHWARFDIDVAPLLRGWRETGCFMYSVNHPKVRPLLDMARVACARMEVVPENPWVSADDVEDTLKVFPTHPVFADIAAAAGVAPEGIFRTAINKDGNFYGFSVEEFVNESFRAFATVKRAVLYRADGVAAALAALGLVE
jgi:Polysaccharide biosynthesis enzyme WcbI